MQDRLVLVIVLLVGLLCGAFLERSVANRQIEQAAYWSYQTYRKVSEWDTPSPIVFPLPKRPGTGSEVGEAPSK